ncbi:uncharacterized protein ACBR49_003664 [Aulostomus maculatus]
MVAEMASYRARCHLEDGDGDIPAPENKDNLTESGSSSSENTETSTEESSEEEEGEEEEDKDLAAGCDEKDGREEDYEETAARETRNESVPGAAAESPSGKETHFKLSCEKCKAVQQNHDHERVTPKRISKGRLQVQLEGEGTYECSVTGLVFETSERVLVRYSVLSWSKFSSFLQRSWKFAGPIFNVDTINKEASVLKSIQFPHSVCLADPENETTFRILHIKDNRPLIEPTVDHSRSHVKWRVTSLSPVGPVIDQHQPTERHGVVLIYKQLTNGNNYSFHIYLATNSSSDIRDIGKQVRGYKNRYVRIEKPPTCNLDEGTYRLLSEPEGEIKPQDLKFTLAVTKMKGYFEAFFEQPPPFTLSLIDTNTEEKVWSATIREGDCVEKKPRKRTISRQGSSSPSEDETGCKRRRWQDESDGVKTASTPSKDLSEKQLMRVARCLGKEWKEVAIYLDISSRELDDIQAADKENVTMQKWKMLVMWKNRRQPGEATASHLWRSLEEMEDLPNEVHQVLQDMMDNRAAK